MNKLLMGMFLIAFVASTHAAELTSEALQGSWRVVTFAGETNEDEDYWEFEGDQFIQNLAGHRLSPDTFTVDGNIIDLDYAKIKVLEFHGDSMKADMAGFEYGLEKQ